MVKVKIGDWISLKKPFWYKNEDLGGRKGEVISTYSYILVQLNGYHSNPIKCFKNEIQIESCSFIKKESK